MKNFRKKLRLQNYDYSQNGMYFVTVCTDFKEQILWQKKDGKTDLSNIGKIVDDCIIYVDLNYDGVLIDKYCIMPNHIHLIVVLCGGESNMQLHNVVGRIKSYTTKQYRELTNSPKAILWQRNFYEHIIRNDEDYAEKWQYIDENVLKWKLQFNY